MPMWSRTVTHLAFPTAGAPGSVGATRRRGLPDAL
jgi:hypothetical protein